MRSLVLGSGGMLGQALAAEIECRGWPIRRADRVAVDVTSEEAVRQAMEVSSPDVVFNCAALTNVDGCESSPQRAHEVNGSALTGLTKAVRDGGALLVQVSTDYVFDGAVRKPYDEIASTAPLSVYGASKLDGETRALEYGRALVARTSWLFGEGGPNFVTTINNLLSRKGEPPLPVVDDQLGCPTYAPFLARALCDLAVAGAVGIVHYRNRDPVTWFGFARRIAELLSSPRAVKAATTVEVPRPAPRPPYSVLAVDRFERLVGRRVEPWEDGLRELLGQP